MASGALTQWLARVRPRSSRLLSATFLGAVGMLALNDHVLKAPAAGGPAS